jgi:methyl-accepting chemotaxis protein
MLLRKLLILLGSVAVLLLLLGVTAVAVLHDTLEDLEDGVERAFDQAGALVEMRELLVEVEANLHRRADDTESSLADALAGVESLEHAAIVAGQGPGGIDRAVASEEIACLRKSVMDLAADRATDRAPERFDAAFRACDDMAGWIDVRSSAALRSNLEHRAAIAGRFRWTVAGLGIAFVVLLNVSIVLLMRAAGMVLRPIDRLVDASRRLGQEDFTHRVTWNRRDEFGELASAMNELAEQLGQNEQRKLETLHQVARTLNHELNNALSVITFQAEIVARLDDEGGELRQHMQRIQEALERMRGTIAGLTRIQRVVLTEYGGGEQMVDLAGSIDPAPDVPVEGRRE